MKILSVRSRQDFLSIQKNNENSYATKNIVFLQKRTLEKYTKISSKQRCEEFVRLGLSVSKKISKKAVVRNRVKRLLREAFRIVEANKFYKHNDYVIIARVAILESNVSDLVGDINLCLSKIHSSQSL